MNQMRFTFEIINPQNAVRFVVAQKNAKGSDIKHFKVKEDVNYCGIFDY